MIVQCFIKVVCKLVHISQKTRLVRYRFRIEGLKTQQNDVIGSNNKDMYGLNNKYISIQMQ